MILVVFHFCSFHSIDLAIPNMIKPLTVRHRSGRRFRTGESLPKAFKNAILDRAWAEHHELKTRRADKMKTQSVEEFLGNE